MEIMFENFGIGQVDLVDNIEGNHPFMVVCRDREETTEERWVLTSLSTKEAKEIYEYLGKYF